MKLYMTHTSCFARMARAAVREKGLQGQVEEIFARTREAGSPYYEVVRSGRVPALVLEDGRVLEDTSLIIAYLDQLAGQRQFAPPDGEDRWEYLRLEAMARSFMDGVAVWVRELRRLEEHRSPIIIAHETERARRLAAMWDGLVDHEMMMGAFNLPQLTLISTLQLDGEHTGFDWRAHCPRLVEWEASVAQRPALVETNYPSPEK